MVLVPRELASNSYSTPSCSYEGMRGGGGRGPSPWLIPATSLLQRIPKLTLRVIMSGSGKVHVLQCPGNRCPL